MTFNMYKKKKKKTINRNFKENNTNTIRFVCMCCFLNNSSKKLSNKKLKFCKLYFTNPTTTTKFNENVRIICVVQAVYLNPENQRRTFID